VYQRGPYRDRPESEPVEPEISRQVSLQVFEKGRGYAFVQYRKYSDGTVRRFTQTPEEHNAIERIMPEQLPNIGAPAEEIEAMFAQWDNRAQQVAANFAVLESRGLQSQPIGIDEIDGLTDLFSAPGVTARSRRR
jgi:hypothetical protein